jgi:FkbM family methyltransferase
LKRRETMAIQKPFAELNGGTGCGQRINQADKMNPRKMFKWVRRLAVSCFTDHGWKRAGIRPSWVGSPSGGAYVDLHWLGRQSVVYSFGIATEISFDRAIIAATGCQVFGFDPDPRCTRWLNEPGRWVPPEFHFSEIALGAASGSFSFHMTDIERMTGSLACDFNGETVPVKCMSLKDIMGSHGHEQVDYLKLDIEGAEYDVLNAWLSEYETLPVQQLWLEFHPDGNQWTERDSQHLVRRLAKIGMVPGYRNYLRCPNNCLLINGRIPHPS